MTRIAVHLDRFGSAIEHRKLEYALRNFSDVCWHSSLNRSLSLMPSKIRFAEIQSLRFIVKNYVNFSEAIVYLLLIAKFNSNPVILPRW